MKQTKTILIVLSLFWATSCADKQTKSDSQSTEKSSTKVDSIGDIRSDNVVHMPTDSIIDPMLVDGFGDLKIELDYKQVQSEYGIPDSLSKMEIWGADGEYHQTVYFTKMGIELDVIGDNEVKRTVNMITIKSPSKLRTKYGIGIGSHYEDVLRSYKASIDTESLTENSIVVGSIYGGLIFELKDKVVTLMFLGAAAE